MFKENLRIIAVKNTKGGFRKLDYYLIMPNGNREYLITRPYVQRCYDMCKGGMRMNDLLQWKGKNRGTMELVARMRQMSSYISYEFDIA